MQHLDMILIYKTIQIILILSNLNQFLKRLTNLACLTFLEVLSFFYYKKSFIIYKQIFTFLSLFPWDKGIHITNNAVFSQVCWRASFLLDVWSNWWNCWKKENQKCKLQDLLLSIKVVYIAILNRKNLILSRNLQNQSRENI